jgi:hypothetical protein
MIPAARWSIRRLCELLLLCAVTTTFGEDPVSVLSGILQRLSGINTLHAVVKRRQTYRNVCRDARGILLYDRATGTRYEWKSPGHYLFFASDSLLYGIDMNKRCGWKAGGDRTLRRQTDPLERLFRLQYIDPGMFTYRGNNDSLLFFSFDGENGTRSTIGIEPARQRCRIIERFDENHVLLEKTVFFWETVRDTSVLPDAIIITGMYGSDLAADTIRFCRQQVDKKVKREEFAIPEGIAWRENGTGGCLPQHQLHPAAGR